MSFEGKDPSNLSSDVEIFTDNAPFTWNIESSGLPTGYRIYVYLPSSSEYYKVGHCINCTSYQMSEADHTIWYNSVIAEDFSPILWEIFAYTAENWMYATQIISYTWPDAEENELSFEIELYGGSIVVGTFTFDYAPRTDPTKRLGILYVNDENVLQFMTQSGGGPQEKTKALSVFNLDEPGSYTAYWEIYNGQTIGSGVEQTSDSISVTSYGTEIEDQQPPNKPINPAPSNELSDVKLSYPSLSWESGS